MNADHRLLETAFRIVSCHQLTGVNQSMNTNQIHVFIEILKINSFFCNQFIFAIFVRKKNNDLFDFFLCLMLYIHGKQLRLQGSSKRAIWAKYSP